MVPSLNLLSQTLTEWTQESSIPLNSYAVCSDTEVGKKSGEDFEMSLHELQYPATTNEKSLADNFSRRKANRMNVVFSTYHSIDVISKAQKLKKNPLPEFDLIICDEAHRTTGAKFAGNDESAFVKIHNAKLIKGKKRLYMTATPRVYGPVAKAIAEKDDTILFSMDDEKQYGKTLHTLTFSEAVHNLGILSDYKVIVLTISEDIISLSLQKQLSEDNSLKVNDAAKIVGCWRALTKMDIQSDLASDPSPMRRAVAFCQVIDQNKNQKTHKTSSKQIASLFDSVVSSYREDLIQNNPDMVDVISALKCEVKHVDGRMNAQEKNQKLQWLKDDTEAGTCRILSNVRCLSEGVDVPALDAVMFLTPRNSQVDVVQSVGRVMRKPPNSNKKLGYVILPVVIPSGVDPDKALDDNKTYRVVWEVLQALRSHDDRFDAMINKLDLSGQDKSKMEVIAITNHIPKKSKGGTGIPGGTGGAIIGDPLPPGKDSQLSLTFEVSDLERAIIAKVVQKCGNRMYWEEWAGDVAKIAQTHIGRIKGILGRPENKEEIAAVDAFVEEIRDDLNDSITRDEAIEMLAQHIITKPVFDALFEGYSFTQNNPVSRALQSVMDILDRHHLKKESDTLERFYADVKMRASGITDIRGKQSIVVKLYDQFFRKAFPTLTERLGIVYTPVEVVDFIIHSVNAALKNEFGQTLGSKGVHILDPFTGTGTFITRLLQSGLIKKDELTYKYKNEIHANEIVLLAYYIAAINIEQVYHELMQGDYESFNGICLTDTFQLYEKEDLVQALLIQNSERRKRQKKLDIRVIMGNPPYSIGQKSQNDNAANIKYPYLDNRIRQTYVDRSIAANVKGAYDNYIRAIRWASDRIGQSGVIGFVTNAGWLDSASSDGMRQCLVEEFSSLYIFNLRGNARTKGEQRRKEKDNVFGVGSRAPIAISILVKNPHSKDKGKIYYHDIGDYLSRENKLKIIEDFKSIDGISEANQWQSITPDEYGDWLNQRDPNFNHYIVLGDKRGSQVKLFENFSQGLQTNRDAWCYNASKREVAFNMQRMIDFYNSERERFYLTYGQLDKKLRDEKVNNFINTDEQKISWSSSLIQQILRNRIGVFDQNSILLSLYRPFSKQYLYFDSMFNHRVGQIPQIFPSPEVENRVICVTGGRFSVLITNIVPDLHLIGDAQCFPLYLYEESNTDSDAVKGQTPQSDMFDQPEQGLFDNTTSSYTRKDAITDEGLNHFQKAYSDITITKEDIFYYIYGLLHSEEYRTRYADNLSKQLPRIPCVKAAKDFWAFSKAGRQLADLHLNYEKAELYPVTITGANDKSKASRYRVDKIRYGKNKDKTTLLYNEFITISGIPEEAYDYVVNEKAALDWVIERQAVSIHKDSGIVNDANDWAIETMDNPKYSLELIQRIITVSLETMKIVRKLPELEIQ